MSRIFLDTNFFIYVAEGSGRHAVRTRYLLHAFAARKDEVLTSVMSVGEVLVGPLARGDHALALRYRQMLHRSGITVLPFVEQAAEQFAVLCAGGKIKPPDAIQLATAGTAGCDLFLTNDERLMGTTVRGIHFITSFEKAPV
jgi:predicted nucleic acid-binding protein